MKRPNLSIIIVNWNTKEILKDCIDSVFKNRGEISLETIIIDNGSSDGSVEKIEELIKKYPAIKIRLIKNKDNLGFSKANNQAIKIAKGKYIFLLNSDTVLKKNSLEKLISYLEKNKDVAAVSPMLFNPDGTKQVDYYMKFPNIFQILFYHNPVLRPVAMKTPLKNLIVSKTSSKPFEVDQLPGAAILTTKTIFSKTKGLDDDYFFLFEDVDWCYRVKERKLGKLIVVPASKIIHLGGASWKTKLEKNGFEFYKQYFSSLLIFIDKHYKTRPFYIFTMSLTFLLNAISNMVLLKPKKSATQLKLLLWSLIKLVR
jgi:hypothetical protein